MAGIFPKDILQLNQFVDEHTLLLQNEEKHCFQHNWLPGSYVLTWFTRYFSRQHLHSNTTHVQKIGKNITTRRLNTTK